MNFTPVVADLSALSAWPDLFEQALRDAINPMADLVLTDFERTVETWTKQPDFTIERAALQAGDMVALVWTDNEVYGYVNFGTRPHDIFPRNAKRLHFLSGYTPKTSKSLVGSNGGGATGNDVFAAGVHHPGSEARAFDQAIVIKRQGDFATSVGAQLALAALKALGS